MEKNLYHEIYDKAYEGITPDWLDDAAKVDAYLNENNKTLREFFEDYSFQFGVPKSDWREIKVLDLGCGLGGMSQYFANKGAHVTGIDVSDLAVTAARELAGARGLEIDFIQADLSKPLPTPLEKEISGYDIVFDSHLLHCLTGEEDRKAYFSNVKNALAPEGIYLLETMVFQKQFRTPVGYSMDDSFILWKEDGGKENGGKETPVRKILPGMELETEIKNSGLHINYLYFHAELSFQVFDEYEDYPHQNLPHTARLSAKLNS